MQICIVKYKGSIVFIIESKIELLTCIPIVGPGINATEHRVILEEHLHQPTAIAVTMKHVYHSVRTMTKQSEKTIQK